MALLPSSSSSTSSITCAFTYDVFLSFRGEDTRYGFTGNLYKALCSNGIHTFIDDEELHKGDEITPALIKAIEKSRIFILVLSKDYASSSYCLDELSKILDYSQEEGRLVWPVFYDVDPSDVRKQTGTFGEAMALHTERFKDNKDKLQKWRMALQQVANFSGWNFKKGHEYEHNFIMNIVEEVSKKIKRVALYVAAYPVGLESAVLNVISLLDLGSHDKVHLVGIHGIGGIGKTTLALAVYNLIAKHFDGLCFLENVRENSDKYGLLHLQKTLLVEVLEEKEIEITSVKQGISIIQHRLQQKKVLLILDDIDKEEQLQCFIGRSNWVGPGSRVIITTRDKHLLACHGVERTFEVGTMEKEHAFNLLIWKAFKNDKVCPSYMDILNRMVAYASGLPLALEVIGSNLYRKSIQEWESALEKYERIPDKKIQEILKVSFDALQDEEQSVFLDIACCFKGYLLEEVKNILNAHHDQCITYQIGVLVEKSLIKINHSKKVTLHDLIEDMGKEIVRQESPKVPGKRSRLWSHEDIVEVLEENLGTEKNEIICLDFPLREEVECDGNSFKKMKSLRTLIVKRVHFSKGPEYLPNSLRVLEWWKYPSQHLPSNFHPKKLSICKIPDSCFTSLESLNSFKGFVNIKVLNLDDCKYLTHVHDISSLSNLEEFSFRKCVNLTTTHNSVGLLSKLKILDASYCCKLRSVPPLKLPSLEKLELSFCSSLESFPEILEKMEKLTHLDLIHTDIKKFPSSFRNLTRLRKLIVNLLLPMKSSIRTRKRALLLINHDKTKSEEVLELKEDDNEENVISMLSSKIEFLSVLDKNLPDDFLASVLPYLGNLKRLKLSVCNLTSVPECIKECRYLQKLEMDYCLSLEEIKAIPPSLKYLSAQGCTSLNFSSRSMLLKQELHERGDTFFCLPSPRSLRVPEWFEHQSRGLSPSVSFWFRNNFPCNILLCIVCPGSAGDNQHFCGVHITVNGKECFHKYRIEVKKVNLGHTCLLHVQEVSFEDKAYSENMWNHAEVVVEEIMKHEKQVMVGIGTLVLKEEGGMDDIRFTNPDRNENCDSNALFGLEEGKGKN